MVQCFGHARCDQSIDAVAILLVEKAYVNKGQHQLWTTKFGEKLMKSTKKHAIVADNIPMSPWKHWVLGEQGNMMNDLIDPCDVMEIEEPSAEELWLWQQMESAPDIEVSRVSPLIIDTTEASAGATQTEQAGEAGDGGEDDNSNDEEGDPAENHLSHSADSMMPNTKKARHQKKKGSHGSKTASIKIDFNLATFLHNNLLPASDPRAGCQWKALNHLYGNNFLSRSINSYFT